MTPEQNREKLKELMMNIYRRLERLHGSDHAELQLFRLVAKKAGWKITPGIGVKATIEELQ